MTAEPGGPSGRRRLLAEWPTGVVLLAVVAGLAYTLGGHFKRGSFVIGVSVLLAGALRAFLPTPVAGLLAVRSRTLDVVAAVGLGLLLLVVTLVVPPPS